MIWLDFKRIQKVEYGRFGMYVKYFNTENMTDDLLRYPIDTHCVVYFDPNKPPQLALDFQDTIFFMMLYLGIDIDCYL